MAYAGRFVESGPTSDPDFGTNESWAAYSEGDLTAETRLTLVWYGKAIIDPLAGESIVVACRGLPAVYGNGHFFWKLNIDGSMTIIVNATTQIIATTVAGVWVEDTPFSAIVVFNFNLAGQNKVRIYINGTVVAWDAWADGGVTAFENLGSFPRYIFGWRHTSGTAVQDLWIDYLMAWTGVAATALQAAEYGGSSRVNNGTLGLPTHLWDFEQNLNDTGASPFSLGYNQNITFVAEALHTISPAQIAIVNADGGEIVEMEIGVADGEYYLDLGTDLNAARYRAYSGVPGRGNVLVAKDGIVPFVVPRVPPAEDYVGEMIPVGGGSPIGITTILHARRRPLFSATQALRKSLPHDAWDVGPVKPELEVVE